MVSPVPMHLEKSSKTARSNAHSANDKDINLRNLFFFTKIDAEVNHIYLILSAFVLSRVFNPQLTW